MRLLVTTLLLTTLWILVLSNGPRDKIFFLQKSNGEYNQTLLVVTWADEEEMTDGCEVFSDEDLIKEVLKSSSDKRIMKISEEEMNSLLEDCTEISMRRRRRQSGGYPDRRGPPPRQDDSRNMDRDGYYRDMSDRDDDFRDIPSRDSYDRDASNRDGSYRDMGNTDGSSRNTNNRDGNSRDKPNRDNDNKAGWRTRFNEEKQRVPYSNSNRRRASGDNSDDENSAPRQSSRDRADSSSSSNEINDDVETTTYPEEMAPPATEGSTQWPIIWPGTKWCGSGDIAKNYDDLGLHEDTDRCCRAHDLCNDTILAGESKHNLSNKSPFTKLSCQCDQDFYSCLDRVNTIISNTIGNLYFNVLKRECYQEDHPLTKKCKKYKTFLKLTCKEYERDTKSPKVFQWFPAKRYKKIPFPGPLTVTLPF